MTLDISDLAGLLGSALMVVGYAYSNMARVLNFVAFNLLNLIGSILLIASLSVHFNFASMTLEIVWGIIAALGLARALRRGKAA